MEKRNSKTSKVDIDNVEYTIHWTKKSKKPSLPPAEETWRKKLQSNMEAQAEEVNALRLIFKDKFRVEDSQKKKYSIEFFVRGGQDAFLNFSFPPEYPSDMPPVYSLSAPWMRKSSLQALYQELSNCFSANFGRCIMYLWADIIQEALKEETNYLKAHRDDPTPAPVEERNDVSQEKGEKVPEVYMGQRIWDRKSCFTPYLARVTSEEEVKRVIEHINSTRKVHNAWRNTYAYRYKGSDGKMVEVEEDGGENNAGKNLLSKLVSYDAENVIVYISRIFGGKELGSDRFRHLNNAADDVLSSAYKKPEAAQGPKTPKKNKKASKYKK